MANHEMDYSPQEKAARITALYALIGVLITVCGSAIFGPIIVEFVKVKIINNAATSTPDKSWAITFRYDFPIGYWGVGEHFYEINADCPSLSSASGSWSQEFTVADYALLYPDSVYLRKIGIQSTFLDENPVDAINPQQSTAAVYTLVERTESEIGMAARDCTVTITWDGNYFANMVTTSPFRH